jgi:hypothetical protein
VVSAELAPAFRRFPWIQVVFCVACLAMTAWTWMTHSYAWPTTPEDATADFLALMRRETAQAPRGRDGEDARGSRPFGELPRPYLAVRGRLVESAVGADGLVYGRLGAARFTVVLPADEGEADAGSERTYVGRLRYEGTPRWFCLVLDTTASRFAEATVAGLVVGAMGCFIFGLYLRAWLRERKQG